MTSDPTVSQILFQAANALRHPNTPDKLQLDNEQWVDLLREAGIQRCLPMIAKYLIDNEASSNLPYGFKPLLVNHLEANRIRNRLKITYAKELIDIFRAEGISIIPRKGVVYEDLLYGGSGVRNLTDIDFYARPQDAKKVRRVLESKGYTAGGYFSEGGSLCQMTRLEVIRIELHRDHLPPFAKVCKNSLFSQRKLDFSLDLSWHGATPEVAEAAAKLLQTELQRYFSYPDTTSYEFHFVDCALHIYREAFYAHPNLWGWNGARVGKFLDLVLLFSAMGDTELESLRRNVGKSPLEKYIFWSAFYADELFGTDIVAALEFNNDGNDVFLRQYYISPGVTGRWTGTIYDRIFQPENVLVG